MIYNLREEMLGMPAQIMAQVALELTHRLRAVEENITMELTRQIKAMDERFRADFGILGERVAVSVEQHARTMARLRAEIEAHRADTALHAHGI